LDQIGEPLEESLRSDAIRAEAPLHEAHDAALGVHDHEPDDRGNDHHDEQDLDRGQDRLESRRAHRSTSPSTMSTVPISATRFETRCPPARQGSAWRLMNEGGRTCSRYGLFVPFETR